MAYVENDATSRQNDQYILMQINAEMDVINLRVRDKILLTGKTLNSHLKKIEIKNCDLGSIDIEDIETGIPLIFQDCKIHSLRFRKGCSWNEVRFLRSEVTSLEIDGAVKAVNLYDHSKAEFCLFETAHIEQLFVDNQSGFKHLYMVDCTGNTSIDFVSTKECQSAAFRKCDIKLVRVSLSAIEEISIVQCKKIGAITLSPLTEIPDVNVSETNFGIFSIRGATSSKGKISIAKAQIDFLNINDFQNLGQLNLTDIEIKHEAEFKYSQLGKSAFTGVNFSNAPVVIRSSDFHQTTFSTVVWNKEYKLNESDKNLTYQTLAESYRQLKTSYLKSSNFIDASRFKYHELRSFYNHLRSVLSEDIRAMKFRPAWRNLGDFLILWTSKKSSDFGESVGRPLYLMTLFHLVLFCLLLIAFELPIKFTSIQHHSWEAFGEGFRLYVYLMSPAHSIKVGNVEIYGVLDTLMRISSAYFLYYFLKASRKFHTT